MGKSDQAALDRRFMAAAIRLSRKHLGLTGTNPSVGTLIVRDDGDGPHHRAWRHRDRRATACRGGSIGRSRRAGTGRDRLCDAGTLRAPRPHAALRQCVGAAGVKRVVGAATDPDDRVSGKGYAILRAAGIEVVEGMLAAKPPTRWPVI